MTESFLERTGSHGVEELQLQNKTKNIPLLCSANDCRLSMIRTRDLTVVITSATRLVHTCYILIYVVRCTKSIIRDDQFLKEEQLRSSSRKI